MEKAKKSREKAEYLCLYLFSLPSFLGSYFYRPIWILSCPGGEEEFLSSTHDWCVETYAVYSERGPFLLGLICDVCFLAIGQNIGQPRKQTKEALRKPQPASSLSTFFACGPTGRVPGRMWNHERVIPCPHSVATATTLLCASWVCVSCQQFLPFLHSSVLHKKSSSCRECFPGSSGHDCF